jgi:phage shock protein PspC (stress-responsive transcriptional regulator)
MKKIVAVHLAGRVFQMEEDAHDFLASVLSGQINKADTEQKVSDLLAGKVGGSKTVVTRADVVDVLAKLGYGGAGGWQQGFAAGFNTKNLFRPADSKVIAGVCAGLGRYLDVDPVILRVLFVLALFFLGSGVLLYLILWIVIPSTPRIG